MDKLFEYLKQNNLTISTAESCTGGMIASAITNVSGASGFFGTGVVTYSNEAKMKLIGVNKETLEKYGAVSEQTAKEMAEGVLKLGESDVSVAVSPSVFAKALEIALVIYGAVVFISVTVSLYHNSYPINSPFSNFPMVFSPFSFTNIP